MNSISTPRRVALVLGFSALSIQGHSQPYGYPTQAPGYPPSQQYTPPPGGYPQYPQGYSQPQGGYYAPPAQQQSQLVSPLQFLPTFGKKFGEMFRRVFYGDAPSAQPYYPPQGRLDQPPQGYSQPQQHQYPPQYQQAPQPQHAPRYETPPPPQGAGQTMPPSSRMNPGTVQPPSVQRKNSTSGSSNPKSNDSNSGKRPSSNYKPPTIIREQPQEEMPPPLPKSDPLISKPDKLPGSKPPTSSQTAEGHGKKPADNTAPAGGFLRGKKTGKEGRVISPYPPYRELDVSGLSSGSLALDPTTQKVFEVP